MYENGEGVEQDSSEAFTLYLEAAEGGNKFAQNNVGRFYDYGLGIEVDDVSAVKW